MQVPLSMVVLLLESDLVQHRGGGGGGRSGDVLRMKISTFDPVLAGMVTLLPALTSILLQS
jgi:hypothetical protein